MARSSSTPIDDDVAPASVAGMTGESPTPESEETSTSGSAPSWTDAPDFGSDEIGYPLLRLAQGLTAEVSAGEARPGDWVLGGYPAEQAVTFVPLMYSKTRTFRAPGPRDQGQNQVLCSSPDGIQGFGDPGVACVTCPNANWGPQGPNGKSSPPPCTIFHNYVGFSVEHGMLVMVSFSRTKMDAAKAINSFYERHTVRGPSPKRQVIEPGFGKFAVRLTSKMVTTPGRVYAQPIVNYALLTPEIIEASGGLIPRPTPALAAPSNGHPNPSSADAVVEGESLPF